MFCTFAGNAQTLTCTFQFMGSGMIGTQTFTNAAITITTVGDASNRQTSGPGEYYIDNTSASISISGVGSFQFKTPPPIGTFLSPSNPAPGTSVNQYFTFGSKFGFSTALLGGGSSTTNPWYMLSSIGPVSLTGAAIMGWSISPIPTSGGTINLYDTTTSLPMTFQATLTGGTPMPPVSRVGVLSHIAAGGGWSTVITLVNNSSAAVPLTVALHNDDGSALSLSVTTTQQGAKQTATTSSVNASINPHSSLLISVGDQAGSSAVVGWADVSSTAPVCGYAIFRATPQGGSPSEGTVPLQTQFPSTVTLPFDNTAGFVTGAAIANLSATSAIITATIWDDSGNQLGLQNISIPASGHTSLVFPNQIPLTSGKRGIVQVQSSATGGIAGLGLRFSPFGTFTSVPTM
jgi:hypothetical protein